MRKADGFSLPELLAVLAMIAIAIAIGIPLVNEQVRIAEIRAAADDLALHLRAARMMSVTQHRTVKFRVYVEPDNKFKYEKFEDKWKEVVLPDRVRIVAASDRLINFKQNGSVDVASSIILESTVSGQGLVLACCHAHLRCSKVHDGKRQVDRIRALIR